MSNELNKSLHDSDVNIILEFKKKWDTSTDIQTKLLTASLSDELNNKGCDCFSNGDIDSAIEFYNKALVIMAINDDVILNLAICHNKKQEFHCAIYNLHKLYILNPINLYKNRIISYVIVFHIVENFDSGGGAVFSSRIIEYFKKELSLSISNYDINEAVREINSSNNRKILLLANSPVMGLSSPIIYSSDGTEISKLKSIARAILNWKDH